ncbi:MAG: FAD-binding oxidoreductase [Chloroflexota bacterium]
MTATLLRTIGESTVELLDQEIEGLNQELQGDVLRPDDVGYDEARSVWNGMIDRRPALIAMCETTDDVVRSVRFARKHNLLTSVRGGGHNIAGTAICEDGLMISLARMRNIDVDTETKRVKIGPGATWGEVDAMTQPHGLTVPSGIISTTGVSGLTLGGGWGWLTRSWGYTCDRLRSAEMVTADGEVLRASESEHPDLFWGLRGGGGNFGIVTEFEFEAVPLGPEIVAGMVLYPFERFDEIADFFTSFTETAPKSVTSLFLSRAAPPLPIIPEEVHGDPVVGMVVICSGSIEEGERLLQPVKDIPGALVDTIKVKPFTEHQSFLDAGQPHGRHYYWKSEYLSKLNDDVFDATKEYCSDLTSPHSALLLMHLGGQGRKSGSKETGAAYRDAEYACVIQAAWDPSPESEPHVRWARTFHQEIQPSSTGHTYVNFLTDDERDPRIRQAFEPEIYERLAQVKRKYDPENVFRLNKNIPPANS